MSWVCRTDRRLPSRIRPLLIACSFLLIAAAQGAAAEVLFDQGHGQRFLIEGERPLDLGGLAGVFRAQRARVRSTTAALSAQTLKEADILVIAGPFTDLAATEIAAVEDFLRQGGKLVIMAHIAQPLGSLLERLGVAISISPVQEGEHLLEGRPTEFSVEDLTSHPLLQGLSSFRVYGAWALLGRGETVQELARTSGRAWLDLDQDGQPGGRDPVRAFPLLVSGRLGRGTFVVFGDDALFQNRFLAGENLQLAKNLAAWLCAMCVGI